MHRMSANRLINMGSSGSNPPPVTISAAMRLYPQTRKVLSHLERRGSISPLEAFGVYRITRLAARIKELRDFGLNITTEMREDDLGTRYATYSLAPTRH